MQSVEKEWIRSQFCQYICCRAEKYSTRVPAKTLQLLFILLKWVWQDQRFDRGCTGEIWKDLITLFLFLIVSLINRH